MDFAYDIDFAFREYGFDWVPADIDRSRLFNVSFEIGTGDVKLYVLDRTGSLLHKISRDGITVQRSASAAGADPQVLREFLGQQLDFTDLILDTVEDDTFYVYLDPSSPSQYVTFLGALCKRYGCPRDRLIEVVNRLNRRKVENVYDCMLHRCVSGAKVPVLSDRCKLYSRPFSTGNGFDLVPDAARFLRRLYRCDDADLQGALRHLWVSSELFSDRLVLTTQRHAMVHGRT